MKNTFLLAYAITATLFTPTVPLAAPFVTNVTASQRPSGDRAVDISYDLLGGAAPMTVSLLVSNDNGETFSITPQSQYLTGDVGTGITNGNGYAIVWDAMAEVPEIYWPETRVRVIATEATPLEITSTLASGSVSQTQNQTFTFTFGAPITGFDASDVTLTGATKGVFSGSGATYTLEVTSTGGTVTASVPQDAVSPGNQPATFSNFYQDTWTISLPDSETMELIRIPAGTFTMGSPDGETSRNSDETQHTVTLTQDFYLGKTEVTQNQWVALQSFRQAQSFVDGTMPVHNIAYHDVGSWITALNEHITEPSTFALPTESQWEYAARAGTTTRFNFGDGFASDETTDTSGGRGDNMWFTGNNSPSGTKAVGQKPANAWGLHDMHGNVWEWCSDWYGTYPGTVADPIGPESGSIRVFRGGSWSNGATSCRSARRNGSDPSFRVTFVGFRVLAVR